MIVENLSADGEKKPTCYVTDRFTATLRLLQAVDEDL